MFRMEVGMDEIPLTREARRLFLRVRLAIVAVFLAAVCCAALCGSPQPVVPSGRDVSADEH
jgi:hypothetical protein